MDRQGLENQPRTISRLKSKNEIAKIVKTISSVVIEIQTKKTY